MKQRLEGAIIGLIVGAVITILSYAVYSLSLYLYNQGVNEFVIAGTVICGISVFVGFSSIGEE